MEYVISLATNKKQGVYHTEACPYTKRIKYKNKIKELENEVKTARGESRLALLDRIAYFRSLLYEAYLNQSNCVYTYSSKVTKFTFNELSFYIDDTEYNLTRIND